MKLHALPCAALVALHCLGSLFATPEGWTSDFEAAKKQAAEQKKDLLIEFTGSDWCPICLLLSKDVLTQEDFKAYVKDKYVLVEIDFPKDKSKLSDATKEQNELLHEKYGIPGFPTIVLAASNGEPFAMTGYEESGPAIFLATLDGLRGNKARRDQGFAAAVTAEGVEQAKQYAATLKAMGLEDKTVTGFYGDVVEKIKKTDPKDETGFIKERDMRARLAVLEVELNKFGETNDLEGALKFVEMALMQGAFEGEVKQQILQTKATILAQSKKFDEAIKTLDEVKAVAPDSEFGKAVEENKQRLEEKEKNPGGDKSAEEKK